MTDAARRILLAILVLGVVGIMAELLLLNHIEHFPVQDLLLLLLLNIIMIALAIVLFPYLWRE